MEGKGGRHRGEGIDIRGIGGRERIQTEGKGKWKEKESKKKGGRGGGGDERK